MFTYDTASLRGQFAYRNRKPNATKPSLPPPNTPTDAVNSEAPATEFKKLTFTSTFAVGRATLLTVSIVWLYVAKLIPHELFLRRLNNNQGTLTGGSIAYG